MRRIRYCVNVGCERLLPREDALAWPLCGRCWRSFSAPHRETITILVEAGADLAAQVWAALVADLPQREAAARYFAVARTWPTVRAGIEDRCALEGIDFEAAVEPWREYIAGVYWSLGGPDSLAGWTCVEIAIAMTRARAGVHGYEPYLFAAAVDVDRQLAAEGIGGQLL